MNASPAPSVSPRRTVVRWALVASLLALAATLAWTGVARAMAGESGAPIFVVGALVPLAAIGVGMRWPGRGAALAIVAALVGAVLGIADSFCLCAATLSTESIALLIVSLAVLLLAMATLIARGLGWAAALVGFGIFVVAFGNNPFILLPVLAIAGLIGFLVLRRRPAPGRTPS